MPKVCVCVCVWSAFSDSVQGNWCQKFFSVVLPTLLAGRAPFGTKKGTMTIFQLTQSQLMSVRAQSVHCPLSSFTFKIVFYKAILVLIIGSRKKDSLLIVT